MHTTQSAEAPARNRVGIAVVVIVFFSVVTIDAWLLATHLRGEGLSRAMFALRVLGLYSVALGFVQKSKDLSSFANLTTGLTSANLFEFISSNLYALAYMMFVASLGLMKGRQRTTWLSVLGAFLLVLATPFLIVYSIFHILVIMPMAYIGFVGASAIVEAITGSAHETNVNVTDGGEPQTLNLKAVIAADPVASKSFLVGIPATALSFMLELAAKYIV